MILEMLQLKHNRRSKLFKRVFLLQLACIRSIVLKIYATFVKILHWLSQTIFEQDSRVEVRVKL
jgi:hypothetical protein